MRSSREGLGCEILAVSQDPCAEARGSFMNRRRGSVGLGRKYEWGQSSRRRLEAAKTVKLADLELAEKIGGCEVWSHLIPDWQTQVT